MEEQEEWENVFGWTRLGYRLALLPLLMELCLQRGPRAYRDMSVDARPPLDMSAELWLHRDMSAEL